MLKYVHLTVCIYKTCWNTWALKTKKWPNDNFVVTSGPRGAIPTISGAISHKEVIIGFQWVYKANINLCLHRRTLWNIFSRKQKLEPINRSSFQPPLSHNLVQIYKAIAM